MAEEITESKLLLVEGRSDERLCVSLLKRIRIRNVQVIDVEGKGKFRARLNAIASSPDFRSTVRSLGIMRDADKNKDNAFRSTHDALVSAGLPAPDSPLEIAGQTPRVGVLIVPDGEVKGELEDMCLASVADDPAMACVIEYLECVEKVAPPPNNRSKAKVQAFLASRRKPGLLLGEAADAGYWDWNHSAFSPLKKLLKIL